MNRISFYIENAQYHTDNHLDNTEYDHQRSISLQQLNNTNPGRTFQAPEDDRNRSVPGRKTSGNQRKVTVPGHRIPAGQQKEFSISTQSEPRTSITKQAKSVRFQQLPTLFMNKQSSFGDVSDQAVLFPQHRNKPTSSALQPSCNNTSFLPSSKITNTFDLLLTGNIDPNTVDL